MVLRKWTYVIRGEIEALSEKEAIEGVEELAKDGELEVNVHVVGSRPLKDNEKAFYKATGIYEDEDLE